MGIEVPKLNTVQGAREGHCQIAVIQASALARLTGGRGVAACGRYGELTITATALCASIGYVHENVGDPINKPRTRFMLHIIPAVTVMILSLPVRSSCPLSGLQERAI